MIKEALLLWFKGFIHPIKTFNEIKNKPNSLIIVTLGMVIFSVLYSLTALLFYLIKRTPVVEPWLPIDIKSYYFWQTFFTIAWSFATWILMSGTAHLITKTSKQKKTAYGDFENALVVVSIAWIIPSFYLMWIPETTFGVLSALNIMPNNLEFPFIFDAIRLMIIPPLWQTALTAIGLKQTHNTGWITGILIGILTTSISFFMFLVFMR